MAASIYRRGMAPRAGARPATRQQGFSLLRALAPISQPVPATRRGGIMPISSTARNRIGAACRTAARGVLAACCVLAPLLVPAHAAEAAPWASNGPIGGNATAIAFDPSSPATVYAGTNGGGFFKSADGGANWVAINGGVQQPGAWNVAALAVDPATPARVHAAVESGVSGGVFTTTDAGQSWTFRSIEALTDLAIDPATPTTLWASGQSVYRSTDAGVTWTPVRSGGSFRSLAVAPSAPATVYAGTAFGSIHKTTDGGATWTALGGPASDRVATIAVDPATPTTVYAGYEDFGVYKSVDGGTTWTPLGPSVGAQPLSVEDLAIDPADPAVVYAAGYLAGTAPSVGVYRSTDGGATWDDTPLVALVRTLVLDPSDGAVLVAGTQDGIGLWRSEDAGASWSASGDGLVNTSVGALATAPSAAGVAYAAAAGEGVFRTGDGGTTWSPTTFTADLGQFFALAVDPSASGTVYLGTQSDGVFKTTDAGASWLPVAAPTLALVTAVVIDPVAPATVYAGGFGGVARSTTGGAAWTTVNTGLFPVVTALAIDPSAPSTVYAGTDPLMGPFTGVFKTTDSGAHWSAVNVGLEGTSGVAVQALAIDPAVPATLYAALEGGGVFKTSDGGASWSEASDGLVVGDESSVDVRVLAVDAAVPGTVWAGTTGAGVYVTNDGGGSWRPANDGLANPSVRALAVEPGRVYAGTAANGAFVRAVATEAAEAVLGRSLVVRDPNSDDASRRKITVAANGVGSSALVDVDALLAGGATLTIQVRGPERSSAQTFVLPASAWSRAGTRGARYADKKGVHGPVSSVVVTRSASGSVKLTATVLGKLGPGAQPRVAIVPPAPGEAGVVRLEIDGSPGLCVGFGGDAGGAVGNDGTKTFRVLKPVSATCS